MKPGILAIWNDVAPEGYAHLEKWYTREHIFERVGLPGFRSGRRYERVSGDVQRFFTCYEADNSGVFASAAYLERLNDPTPWTTEAMRVFRNMVRTACDVHASAGLVRGAFAVVLRADGSLAPTSAVDGILEGLVAEDGVVRAQLWTAAAGATRTDTAEARLRGGDGMIAGALMVDCVRFEDAERMAARISKSFAAEIGIEGAAAIGIYALLCMLDKGTLAGG